MLEWQCVRAVHHHPVMHHVIEDYRSNVHVHVLDLGIADDPDESIQQNIAVIVALISQGSIPGIDDDKQKDSNIVIFMHYRKNSFQFVCYCIVCVIGRKPLARRVPKSSWQFRKKPQ